MSEHKGMLFGTRMTAIQKQNYRLMFEKILSSIPDDRSCFTCSYEVNGECRLVGQKIPNVKAWDDGCDTWQDGGAPF